jgi:uncharacterized membrane protein YeaQ/YmgE (transglycosylase-associated protein family)
MDPYGLIVSLVIGAIAGWLAGRFMRGGGFGLVLNIVIGIAGAVVASWLFGLLNITFLESWGVIGAIITATIGAVVILAIVGLFKK